MTARVRWTGTTTQRGYGRDHQAERERRLRQYKQGDPCAHCGAPITWWPVSVARRYLDLPHNETRTGYLPGLAHRYCNRKDGAVRGNKQRHGISTLRTSRKWLRICIRHAHMHKTSTQERHATRPARLPPL